MRLIVGPNQNLLDELAEGARRHEHGRLRVAVAWAREDGVLHLLEAIKGRISDLRVVVGVNDRGTTVEALLRLLPMCRELWVYFKHPRQTFHPKLYVFQGGAAGASALTVTAGSSNLTTGGLISNFEASVQVHEKAIESIEARAMVGNLDAIWRDFTHGPFAHPIKSPADVEALYRGAYVVTEATMRGLLRREAKERESPFALPTAPPQHQRRPMAAPLTIPFDLDRELPEAEAPPETEDPSGLPPLPYRFFVRTLTLNDIEKLHGNRPGTFEPDLGRNARDTFPSFWGWPHEYHEVTRQLSRMEWEAPARLVSNRTSPDGVEIALMLWYREPRPNHLEEHRWRPGPIGTVRSVVPPDFDEESLVVFERLPAEEGDGFLIRLLTTDDPGYADFRTYLTETRAGHRFGYGPSPGS